MTNTKQLPNHNLLDELPRLETHPNCPAISQQWYEARPLFAAIGKTWANANRNLSQVPDQHKAQLMRVDPQGRSQNVWCVSPQWAQNVIQKLNGVFPTPAEPPKGFKPEVENIPINTDLTIPARYAQHLDLAEQSQTAVALMLLLDQFNLKQIESLEAVLSGKTSKRRLITRTADVFNALDDDDQHQVLDYIEWLKEDLSHD